MEYSKEELGSLGSISGNTLKHLKDIHAKIIVLGPTGSGKTSFINHIIHDDYREFDLSASYMGGDSNTKSITQYESERFEMENGHVKFTFVDTIGFGADDINVTTIFAKMAEVINKDREIHKILLLYKLERFRPDIHADINKMLEELHYYGAKEEHIYLSITYHDIWIDKIKEKFVDDLLSKLTHKIRRENIFYSTFPNLYEIEPALRPFFQSRIVQSKHRAIEVLSSTATTPFSPLNKVVEDMQKQMEQQEQELKEMKKLLEKSSWI